THLHRFTDVAEQRLDRFGISDRGFARTGHSHRLEVLGAHHCAQSATAGDSIAALIPGVHRAGKAYEVFPSRTDGEHLDLTLLALTNGVIRCPSVLPPEVSCRFELCAILVHQEIDRLRGTPSNGDGFESGAFLHRRKHTAEGAIEKQSGEGGLGAHEATRRP